MAYLVPRFGAMRVAIFLAAVFATNASAIAGAIRITSPDHAQTFAYGEMIWHQLYLERPRGQLAARITFSNLPYADSNAPRRDEPFDFRFPGIQFDSARRAFFASGRPGKSIPVARFRGNPACGWIDLAPGAKIYLLKKSGRVTAILTATDYPRAGSQWIETDDNWSLQNLLVALFGQPISGPNMNPWDALIATKP
jgi:hypothetical protein